MKGMGYGEYTKPMKGRSASHIDYLMENVPKRPSEKLGILL
jgi:hypothetical protein